MRRRYSAMRRSCSANWPKVSPRLPSPRSAASSSVPGVVTATHRGGWGRWYTLGTIVRSGIDQNSPSYAKVSCVHIFGRQRTNSSHDFFVVSGFARKPPSSVQVAERPVPTSSRPPERMSSTAVRSAILMGWLNSGTQMTMPWPTRIFFVIVAHLLEGVHVHGALGLARPGPRHRELVEQAEFHGRLLGLMAAPIISSLPGLRWTGAGGTAGSGRRTSSFATVEP